MISQIILVGLGIFIFGSLIGLLILELRNKNGNS